ERRGQLSKELEDGCGRTHARRWGDEGMLGFPDALWGRLLRWRRSNSPREGARGRPADAIAHFWAQKLAENRHILDLIAAGTFTLAGLPVLDAETLDEVRHLAARRVGA